MVYKYPTTWDGNMFGKKIFDNYYTHPERYDCKNGFCSVKKQYLDNYNVITRNPPNNQPINRSVESSLIYRGFTTGLATKEDLLPRRTVGSQNITPIRQGNFRGKRKSSKKEFNAATDLFVDLMVDNKKSKNQNKNTRRLEGF